MKKISLPFKWPGLSLGARLAWWFCAGSVTLTLIIVQIIGVSSTSRMQDQIGLQLANLAYQTSDKLDQGMYERYREFQLLASRRLLGDPAEPLEDKQRLLEQMQQTYGSYAWIGITDLEGRVLAATGGLLVGADVSKRPWFGNALKNIHIGDVHEAKLLATKLPNPSGEPLRFVDVAFPYADMNGRTAGVIGAHMSWAWAEEVQRSVLATTSGPAQAEAFIVSQDGTVLLGPRDMIGKVLPLPGNAAGLGVHRVERWADGKEYLVGYHTTRGYHAYPGLGWTVLVRQDTQLAYAPIREMQRQVLWSGIGIALLFSLLGLINARHITGPLSSLANAARALREGHALTLQPVDSSYTEVNVLASSLSSLVHDLQRNQNELRELNASLEQRIELRTRELASSEARLRTITDSLPVLIAHVDAEGRFQFINRVCEQWFGASQAQLIGATVADTLDESAYEIVLPRMRQAWQGQTVAFEHSRPRDGGLQHLQLQFIPEAGHDGQAGGFYVLTHDITDTKNYQLALQQDLLTDALTGLPNRTACMQFLNAAMVRARRSRKALAVMFLDVDRFKAINDSHGHETGDLVLREFGQRLRRCLRETDLVARLSGDEFVIVAESLAEPEKDAALVAQKVLQALEPAMQVLGRALVVSTSIGIAVSDGRDGSAVGLLKDADQAMYDAKRDGRKRFAFRGASRQDNGAVPA